jgi:plastocyanin
MQRYSARVAVATAVLCFAVVAIVGSWAGDASGMRAGGAAGEGAAAPVVHVVEIREFRFVPASLAVAEGDTIRWVNRDPVPHTATASDSTWDSGRIASEQSWSFVVGRGMSGEYVCAYHPTMTGVIHVVAGSAEVRTPAR